MVTHRSNLAYSSVLLDHTQFFKNVWAFRSGSVNSFFSVSKDRNYMASAWNIYKLAFYRKSLLTSVLHSPQYYLFNYTQLFYLYKLPGLCTHSSLRPLPKSICPAVHNVANDKHNRIIRCRLSIPQRTSKIPHTAYSFYALDHSV